MAKKDSIESEEIENNRIETYNQTIENYTTRGTTSEDISLLTQRLGVDIPKTNYAIETNSYYAAIDPTYNFYTVKNGWCFISIYIRTNTPATVAQKILGGLPANSFGIGIHNLLDSYSPVANSPITLILASDGTLYARNGTASTNYIGTISYPCNS